MAEQNIQWVKNAWGKSYVAHYDGKPIPFDVDESRPLPQGVADLVVTNSMFREGGKVLFKLVYDSLPDAPPSVDEVAPEIKTNKKICPVCDRSFDISKSVLGYTQHLKAHQDKGELKVTTDK